MLRKVDFNKYVKIKLSFFKTSMTKLKSIKNTKHYELKKYSLYNKIE